MKKSIVAIMLAVSLLVPYASAALENWTWGTVTYEEEYNLAPETIYHAVEFTTDKGKQSAHVLEFHPQNDDIAIRAGLSNGYIYGTQTVLGLANALEEEYPNQVIAAVNADFFNLNEGVPFGIMLDEGEILTTPLDYSKSFIIREDGSASIISHGKMMDMTLSIRGSLMQLTGVNILHTKTDSLVLYNSRFATTTKSDTAASEAICTLVSGAFRDGETLTLTVDSVSTDVGNTALQEGQVVLSGIGAMKDIVTTLTPGDEITVSFRMVDEWKGAVFAVAGNQIILQNGEVQDVTDRANAPRTAIGIKADGSGAIVTLDGRQPDHSVGGSFQNVATMLRDMGCVDALNLDGGGSTTFVMRPLGEFDRKVVNRPSGSSARRVANSLVLINTAPENNDLSLIFKARHRTMLCGGTFVGYQNSVFAHDSNYHPKALRDTPTFTVSDDLGYFDQNGAIHPVNPGFVTITARADGMNATATAEFIEQCDTLTSSKTELELEIGESAEIPLTMTYGGKPVEFLRSQLNWAVEGDVGTVTPNGVFTASEKSGEGAITVTQGYQTLRIPVTVNSPYFESTFTDLSEHLWAKEAIDRLTEAGVINGLSPEIFAPARQITRADFMLLLIRMMKISPDVRAEVDFTDVPKDAYYAQALSAAKKLEIAKGSASGEFFPTRPITREEMFTLIYRVMHKLCALPADAPESTLTRFSDAKSITAYAKTPIATLTQNGLISGNASGQVNPKGNTTRAEAAVMIDRVRNATGGAVL